MNSEPYFTRIDEYGTIKATWPDPPSQFYPASHELLAEIVENYNRVAALRKRLSQSDWIVCAEALRILDGDQMTQGEGRQPPMPSYSPSRLARLERDYRLSTVAAVMDQTVVDG